MRKYYFYSSVQTPSWYTLTTDALRESIVKGRDEEGQFRSPFVMTFVFIGKCTEAPDKDAAEANYRNKENLVDCKEPACMLRARREFFEQQHLMI